LSEDTDLYTGGKVSAALPERRMLSIAFAHLPARAVHVFASLGIADILAAGPKHADEIAQAVGAHASSLYRLLRFLSTIEIVEEADDMRFSLTTLGKTLCTQPVSVVRDNVLLMGSPTYWSAFGELPAQIQTGENAFQKIYGGSFFDYLTGHSREAACSIKRWIRCRKCQRPLSLPLTIFPGSSASWMSAEAWVRCSSAS
jgi:hypothetical protein